MKGTSALFIKGPKRMVAVSIAIALPCLADPQPPSTDPELEARTAARGREVAKSVVSLRMQRKRERSDLQALGEELRRVESLLLQVLTRPVGDEPTREIAKSADRVRHLVSGFAARASADSRLAALEPELRTRTNALLGQLAAIVAAADPVDRRRLAISLRSDLMARSAPEARSPGMSPRLERRQIDTSALRSRIRQ